MTDKLNIYQKMHAVMKDIDYVKKEDKKVNNQYKFVSHDAVTAICRKSFVKHGVLSVPTVIEHIANGNRTVMAVKVEFVNIDEPTDRLETISYGYGIDGQDKGVGKAYSYAIKYAYLKVLGLETGDDPERDNVDYVPENAKSKQDVVSAKAVGGSMARDLDRDTQETMRDTAVRYLKQCAKVEAIDTYAKAHHNAWKKSLDNDLYEEIVKCGKDCKAAL